MVLHSPTTLHSPIAQNGIMKQRDLSKRNGTVVASPGYQQLLKFTQLVKSEEGVSCGDATCFSH